MAPKSLNSQSGPSKPDDAAIGVLAFDHARQRSTRSSRRPKANDDDDGGSPWPSNGDPRLDDDDRLLTPPCSRPAGTKHRTSCAVDATAAKATLFSTVVVGRG
jgi:hypothetical protein